MSNVISAGSTQMQSALGPYLKCGIFPSLTGSYHGLRGLHQRRNSGRTADPLHEAHPRCKVVPPQDNRQDASSSPGAGTTSEEKRRQGVAEGSGISSREGRIRHCVVGG
ncbi:MAG: hypothetical protein ABW185_04785 [Sedimenticola sp.]